MTVIDASTVLLAADTEAGDTSERVRQVRTTLPDRGPVLAPSLIVWEVGNVVFAKHPERFGQTHEDRVEVHEEILTGIRLVRPGSPDAERIGALVTDHDLSYYDAAYLELAARGRDGLLITEDRRLLRAGKDVLGEAGCMDAATAWQAIQDGEL